MFKFRYTLIMAFALALLIALSVTLPHPAAAQSAEDWDGFSLGMAKVEITPDLATRKIYMSGYGGRHRKPATEVLDPLYVRALAGIDPTGRQFAVAVVDMIGVSAELREAVLKQLEPHGISDENLLLAATHTHSSLHIDDVLVARLVFGPYDQELFDLTAERIAYAIIQARLNARPARLDLAQIETEGMNRSRLDPAFDVASSSMQGGVQPDPLKYPVDKTMTVLRLTELDGSPIGALVHFSAHPTILSPDSRYVSADYPGVVCKRIEAALGENSVALFLNGALGDTAPTPDWRDGDVAAEIRDMREYGDKLADRAVALLQQVKPSEDYLFSAAITRRELPDVKLRPLWGARMLGATSGWFVHKREAALQVLRLGELVLVAVPGEPTTAVGADFCALTPPGMRCLIVAPANGYIGYVVTPAQYAAGGYAADSCYFGPDTAARLRTGVAIAMAGATR